jgi:glutaconate CoA-transferase subunit A
VIRADPNRTLIPGLIVDAVVHEPFGTHPSYVQGYYDRDNDFYLRWDEISNDADATKEWLATWIYGVRDRAEYVDKMGSETWQRLESGAAWSAPVNYGAYR